MLVAGRRVVVAFAVVAVLFGAVRHHPEVGDSFGEGRDHRSAATELVGAAPAGVVPVAARFRTSFDTEPVSVAGSAKTRAGDHLLAMASVAVAIAVCWWCLRRPDRRLAAPMQRSLLAPLRAPPSFV